MKKLFPSFVVALVVVLVSVSAAFAGVSAEVKKEVESFKALKKAKSEMPAQVAGVKVVSADEAYALFKGNKAVFLDNRGSGDFDLEHIAGAKLFPVDALLDNTAVADTLDKSGTYVLYCNGAKCWRSPAAAVVMKSLGFKNLLWLRDGLPAWIGKGYETE